MRTWVPRKTSYCLRSRLGSPEEPSPRPHGLNMKPCVRHAGCERLVGQDGLHKYPTLLEIRLRARHPVEEEQLPLHSFGTLPATQILYLDDFLHKDDYITFRHVCKRIPPLRRIPPRFFFPHESASSAFAVPSPRERRLHGPNNS